MMKRAACGRVISMCLGILPFLYGCADGQIQKTESNDIMVIVFQHEPYCGGAFPNKTQEAGFDRELANVEFFVKKGNANHDSISVFKAVKTDSLGRLNVQLDTGTYALIFRNKHQEFEAFHEEESTETKVLKAGTVDCFQRWWQTPEAVFHITDTTSVVRCTIASTCNAGFNPCMTYIGPKRP